MDSETSSPIIGFTYEDDNNTFDTPNTANKIDNPHIGNVHIAEEARNSFEKVMAIHDQRLYRDLSVHVICMDCKFETEIDETDLNVSHVPQALPEGTNYTLELHDQHGMDGRIFRKSHDGNLHRVDETQVNTVYDRTQEFKTLNGTHQRYVPANGSTGLMRRVKPHPYTRPSFSSMRNFLIAKQEHIPVCYWICPKCFNDNIVHLTDLPSKFDYKLLARKLWRQYEFKRRQDQSKHGSSITNALMNMSDTLGSIDSTLNSIEANTRDLANMENIVDNNLLESIAEAITSLRKADD